MIITANTLKSMTNKDLGLIVNYLSAKAQIWGFMRQGLLGSCSVSIVVIMAYWSLLGAFGGGDATLSGELQRYADWAVIGLIGSAVVLAMLSLVMSARAWRQSRRFYVALSEQGWEVPRATEQALYEQAITLLIEQRGARNEAPPQCRAGDDASRLNERKRRKEIVFGTAVTLLVGAAAMWIGQQTMVEIFGMSLSSLAALVVLSIMAAAIYVW